MLLAALGLAAVAAPAAGADDGLLPAAAPPVPDPAALATQIAGQAGLGDVLPVLPVEVPLELPETPAAEPLPAPAPERAPQAPAPAPVPAPDPLPAAVQADPANVYVSVRIDSPGDDGAVTQANVAVETPAPQYPSDGTQYQDAVPAPDAPAEPGQVTRPEEETPAAAAWEWSWEWDCGAAPVPAVELPAGAAAQSWIWNWNWDCGGAAQPEAANTTEDVSGYHAAPVQYRPVNVNVSIRINSPGNNGPVTQTNVAVGIVVPAPPIVPPATAVVLPVPAELPPAALPAPAEMFFTLGPAPFAAAPAEPATDDSNQLLPMPASARPGAAVAPERPAGFLAGGAAAAADVASLPADSVAVVARIELRARGAAQAAEAAPRPQARPASPVPRRGEGEEKGLAVAPHDSLGLVPVSGPERTLPFAALVLLAFMFASLHTTLVAARSRPTHEAEADAPPDRPG